MTISQIISLMVGMGVVVGFVGMYLKMFENSKRFWEKANEVKEKVEAAQTSKEIMNIYHNEYQEWKQYSQGELHNSQISYIVGLMTGKLKELKKKEYYEQIGLGE